MTLFRFGIWLSTVVTILLTFNADPAYSQAVEGSHAAIVGEYQWTASMGGGLQESDASIAVGPGGSVVAVGSFQGSADFDPGPGLKIMTSRGSKDSYVTKISTTGELIWAVSVGGAGETVANDVFIDPAGDIYIVGKFSEWTDFDPGPVEYRVTSNGSSDVFLLRLDPFGNLRWVAAMGGSESDEGEAVFLDVRNNIYITGSFEKLMDVNLDPNGEPYWLSSKGDDDIFIIRYTNGGSILRGWSLGGGDESSGRDIVVDWEGNVYIAGDFEGKVDFAPGEDYVVKSVGHEDVFLTKYNDAGYMVWTVTLGSQKHDTDPSVAMDSAGNIYFTGSFESEADFTPVGGQHVLLSRGDEDIFMVKLNPAGGIVWANSVGGIGSDRSTGITVGYRGDYFITGLFENAVDFDPGPASTVLGAMAKEDAFLARYWQTGFLASAQAFSGPQEERGRSVALDQNGAVYVGGGYEGTVDFNVGDVRRVKKSAGAFDSFVTKRQYAAQPGDERVYLPFSSFR